MSNKPLAFYTPGFTAQSEPQHGFLRPGAAEKVHRDVSEENLELGTFTLSPDAFTKLEQCTSESKRPTEELLQAAKRLQARLLKRR
jgi:hypothetical protein